MTTPKKLLSENDVEAEFGLGARWLQGMRLHGGGPLYIKTGRRVYYRREYIEEWLSARIRRSTSDPGADGGTRRET